ncbi:hypothetical protein [Streptomyces sp. NPDC101166]|uniref:hypothetical protein n=1 Tax=Streptomyces sp. NPDC101166 TaxID=3366120 RepID=UPI0037F65D69
MLLLFLANERRLGAGGMGEVYLAYSVAGEPVAVKVNRPDRTAPHTRARFEREATIARTAAVLAAALPGPTDRFRMS